MSANSEILRILTIEFLGSFRAIKFWFVIKKNYTQATNGILKIFLTFVDIEVTVL